WKRIVCRQLALLPQPSVAVHVRKIAPLPVQLVLSNASTKLILLTPLHVSVTEAVPVLSVVVAMVHSRVRSAGQVMTGGTVSLKAMICRHVALLPQPSVAVQVRRIMPLPVQLVLSNASAKLMLTIPLHVSVAVAMPVLSVVGAMVHSSVRSAGQVMTGGAVSLKLMVCRHVALLPQPSVAVQVRRIMPL